MANAVRCPPSFPPDDTQPGPRHNPLAAAALIVPSNLQPAQPEHIVFISLSTRSNKRRPGKTSDKSPIKKDSRTKTDADADAAQSGEHTGLIGPRPRLPRNGARDTSTRWRRHS